MSYHWNNISTLLPCSAFSVKLPSQTLVHPCFTPIHFPVLSNYFPPLQRQVPIILSNARLSSAQTPFHVQPFPSSPLTTFSPSQFTSYPIRFLTLPAIHSPKFPSLLYLFLHAPPLTLYSFISHTVPYPSRFPFLLIPFPFVPLPFPPSHNHPVPSLLTIPFAFMYPPTVPVTLQMAAVSPRTASLRKVNKSRDGAKLRPWRRRKWTSRLCSRLCERS